MSTINLAAWFGWRGSVDTDLKFSEFFFGDHTVMFRCLRQYPNAGPGPVVAAKTGNYFVGQGEFRGDFPGAPVGSKFFVAIGDHQQDYPLPRAITGSTSRSYDRSTFTLFLDGVRQSPTITLPSTSLPDAHARCAWDAPSTDSPSTIAKPSSLATSTTSPCSRAR
jgi:hypothetical protein